MVSKVLVTGANGNLGGKLVAGLAAAPWCDSIVAVCYGGEPDLTGISKDRVSVKMCDLTKSDRSELHELVTGVDAIAHFAAQHPYPTASWTDALTSFDIAMSILDAADAEGVRRFVFASSNHVMGGYKEASHNLAPGKLSADMDPMPGTVTKASDGTVSSSTAYAAAKLMSERACVQRARVTNGRLSTVSLRIGWCQAGENLAHTISATGLADTPDDICDPAVARAQRWFREMWLSNRDFLNLLQCAILSDHNRWPSPGIVLNGMSNNRNMVWEMDSARQLIGFVPVDDCYSE